MKAFSRIAPTPQERAAALPGDGLVPNPDVTMDRAFDLPTPPEEIWPWIVQLGKNRYGWYLPRSVEHFLPRRRRALRRVDPRWQHLAVGDVVPDWGGRDATFQVAHLEAHAALIYHSRRGRSDVSWAIVLHPQGRSATRVHLRLRISPVHRLWLMKTGGATIDLLTIAGLAAGLHERLAAAAGPAAPGP